MAMQKLFTYIYEFIEYRKMVLLEEKVPYDKFVQMVLNTGFFRINAETLNHGIVSVFIFGANGKYVHHGGDMRTLLTNTLNEKKHYEELILIVDKPVLSKKNILDIIVEQRAANPTIVINIYPYHLFCINIPKVSAIPKHKLITQEEAQEFLGREYLQPQDLMQISASDPPVVWLGGRPGDFVQIERPSETAMHAVVIRFITKSKI
ncbi:D205R [African swine fever virus]|uniref:DNA-directed RNA polymerase RPB5 homolog n=7 Tax=African swine fever virus TaxID=10497 RepID=RPB5_ASFB7|nr:RNA polymerase subunit 5 [African swine fever virus]YP_009702355.1 RNA polymerase subunit 5 [African swine fever virus]YP_009702513.1 pD205R [African swine fever virus]YP_009702674.1 RNA polymerase subunit 5 [African swine fever virus]YP_009703560.1 RNA polymerase subunit 5 [African swine fever virus Benin 97/1]YP_009703715.1 RNA polymerase subunit 5 [African swine fever virus OURT 88/3]YP_009703876.1 hypothetical protein F8224_gp115 [African swine fever virus E75]YP_009927232.1 hypotheti